MGRRYGIGKYGRHTYDLGITEVTFNGVVSFRVNLNGRMIVERPFWGEVSFRVNLNSNAFIGPYWDPAEPEDPNWVPILEPPDFWTPRPEASGEFWTPITEPPPQFKV